MIIRTRRWPRLGIVAAISAAYHRWWHKRCLRSAAAWREQAEYCLTRAKLEEQAAYRLRGHHDS